MEELDEGVSTSNSEGLAVAGLAGLLAAAFSGSSTAAETRDATRAASIERETARVGHAFMKAWEKPDAAELAEFFAIPCEIKYGHAADLSFFTSKEQLLEMLNKTIATAGDEVWFFDPVSTWVRGTLMVHDSLGSKRPPQSPAPAELGHLIFLTNIVDGKIRQWIDIGYLDPATR